MSWTEKPPAAIVAFADMRDLLRTQAAKALWEGYGRWRHAAGTGVPAKAALDLAPVAAMLGDAALVAIGPRERCVYRVVGENLKDRIGFDPTGKNYYDFVPEIRRAYARRAMNMVVDRPMGFRADIEQVYSSGEALTIESFGLPLAADEPGIDGFILFSDAAQTRWQRREEPGRRLLGANVVRRDLIDLGFGVDRDFRDLVEA